MASPTPADFVDRVGVTNVDRECIGATGDLEVVDGAARIVALLSGMGYQVSVASNQSGIGQGIFSEAAYEAVTAHTNLTLAPKGTLVNEIHHCPFHPVAQMERYRARSNPWRKPEPSMIVDIPENWDVVLTASFLRGDSLRGLEAAAGIDGQLCGRGNSLSFIVTIRPALVDAV